MIMTMQRISARQVLSFFAAATLAVPAAQAQTDRDGEGGFYIGISGGLAQPLGESVVSGTLTAGTTTIPFTGTVDYRSGWNARATIGFAERGHSNSGADQNTSDFRVEAEYVALRLRRAGFTAGVLSTWPSDNLSIDAGLANAQLRLVGKGALRLWAGGGLGYARASLPDAQNGIACACLGSVKGSGMTYQGKVTVDLRLSQNLQLFTEWAALRVPELRGTDTTAPQVTYQSHWAGTANGGLRVRF